MTGMCHRIQVLWHNDSRAEMLTALPAEVEMGTEPVT